MSTPCPIDYDTKDWVEDSLHLLGSVFGNEYLGKMPVAEPTEAFFPSPYEASLGGALALLSRTAELMGTSVDGVDLALVDERDAVWLVEATDPNGEPPRIDSMTFAVEAEDLNSPDLLVGMFARELGALRLVNDVGVDPDTYDFGPLADLTATFLGLGLFIGALPEVPPESDPTGGRPLHLTLPLMSLGYALSHIAWHQREESPAWLDFARPDVKKCAQQGLRYLIETGESDFAPRSS